MSTLNPFQQSVALYLSGTTSTTLGSDIIFSSLEATSGDQFVVNYEGPGSPGSANGGCAVGVELKAIGSNVSVIDMHSTGGYFNNSYDCRFQCTGGATATAGQASMIVLASEFDVRCPIRAGINAPQFKLDFGTVACPNGINQDAVITFTVGLFTNPPLVLTTFYDNDGPTSTAGAAIVPYVYGTTNAGTTVRGLGTQTGAPSILYQWVAIGV